MDSESWLAGIERPFRHISQAVEQAVRSRWFACWRLYGGGSGPEPFVEVQQLWITFTVEVWGGAAAGSDFPFVACGEPESLPVKLDCGAGCW